MRRGKGSPDKNRDQLDKLYAGRMGICAVLLNVLIRGDTGARDLAGLQERARKVGQCNSRYKGLNCDVRFDLGLCAIAGFSGGCPYSAREFAKNFL